MATATCATCGKRFDAQRKTARFCGPTCRQRAHRGTEVPVAAVEPDSGSKPSGLVAAVRAQLEKVDRLDTPEGAIALTLAETMAAGGHAAQGVAALAKQLHASLEVATRGAETGPADVVDELKERRVRRHSA